MSLEVNMNMSGTTPKSEDSERETNELSNNASDPLATDKSPSPTPFSLDSKLMSGAGKILPLAGRKATGPRTKKGKERSKLNALKHGIYSESFLLKFEKPNQFRALLQGVRRAYKPVGMAEEIEVEGIAVNRWQHRRVLQAENGYLAKNEVARLVLFLAADDSSAITNQSYVIDGGWV
jgi:hypothetical protein